MTRERAKPMDQTSLWTVDAAGAPGKLRRSPMGSPEPCRMLPFPPLQGFVRGMSVNMEILTSSPEDFAAYQKSEQERWFKVIKENDIKGD
jgi:hypothetical protein